MSERRLDPSDPAWKHSLPVFRDPSAGESLAGFMLALDTLNGFDAGQTSRLIRRHSNGAANFGPGYFLTGACFDLNMLARLAGGLPVEAVIELTMQRLLEWLYPSWRGGSTTIGQRSGFRICPVCSASGLLRAAFLLDEIVGCARHAVRLEATCSCGSPIRPFARQQPGRCHEHRCDLAYADIPTVDLDPAELDRVRRRTSAYEDLIAFTKTQPTPLSPKQLAAGLRILLVGGPAATPGLFRPIHDSSLRSIVEVLAQTGQSAAALDKASRTSSTAVTRSAPAVAVRAEGECPNPSCNGAGETVKDGWLRPTAERQYVCMRCGTRFTRSRVLFAFDDLPDYPTWRAVVNRDKVAAYRVAVARACSEMQRPSTYLGADRVFAKTGVPSAAPYQSERAGLMCIVDRSNAVAGAKRRRPARQLRLATAAP